jgi:hypothetical protein
MTTTTRLSDRTWKKLDAEHATYCQNCDWQGHTDDLDPIANVWERTDEGDTIWAGDCPECGAMCFTVAEIERQEKLPNAARAMLAALKAMNGYFPTALPAPGVLPTEKILRMRAAIAQAEAAGIKVQP